MGQPLVQHEHVAAPTTHDAHSAAEALDSHEEHSPASTHEDDSCGQGVQFPQSPPMAVLSPTLGCLWKRPAVDARPPVTPVEAAPRSPHLVRELSVQRV
jgi:hypothetical protein